MSTPITLFDIATKSGTSFSPNAWKARSALNMKGLPYKTHWIEYRDLAQSFKDWGIPPNEPHVCQFPYSIPAVRLADGTFVMESRRIAETLEKIQPVPSLQLDSDHSTRAQAAVDQLGSALVTGVMYRIPDTLLDAPNAAHYHAERNRRIRERLQQDDLTLYDLGKSPNFSGEAAWNNALPALQAIKELLGESSTGPYIAGAQAGFADLIVVSLWKFLAKLDQDGDMYGRVMAFDSSFGEHEKACEEWFRREDH